MWSGAGALLEASRSSIRELCYECNDYKEDTRRWGCSSPADPDEKAHESASKCGSYFRAALYTNEWRLWSVAASQMQ